MNITLKLVRDEWRACYPEDRLAALFDRPHTPLEVLTRMDGPWADVPPQDRLWAVLHEGVLPDPLMRNFACDCAERALNAERAASREPDPRSWEALRVSRLFADGKSSSEELNAAMKAAEAAASAAAASWTAAASAAAARTAAASAAAASWTAEATERQWQLAHLIALVKGSANHVQEEASCKQ